MIANIWTLATTQEHFIPFFSKLHQDFYIELFTHKLINNQEKKAV